MKVLVVGASGLVGSRVLSELEKSAEFEAEGTCLSRTAVGLRRLDITDVDETRKLISRLKPDVIVHTAALTNVDYCEDYRSEAYGINVRGTGNVVDAAREAGCRVVYISTDFVFDGLNGPYGEDDATNPVNYYGRTKLEGETLVSGIGHVIARTTVVYGWKSGSKNFLMQVFGKLSANEEMNVAVDQYGSPTLADNMATAVVELIKEKKNGIYNIAGVDVMNRHEFALKIAKIFDLDQGLLTPVETGSLRQRAVRPMKAGLRVEKAARELKTRLLGVEEGLSFARKQAGR